MAEPVEVSEQLAVRSGQLCCSIPVTNGKASNGARSLPTTVLAAMRTCPAAARLVKADRGQYCAPRTGVRTAPRSAARHARNRAGTIHANE
jgi:hypothetical protein